MKAKIQKRASTLRRVLTYVRPYWFKVLLGMLCTVLCVGGELIIPVFCGDAIDQMIGKGQVLFDGVWHYIIYIIAATVIMALGHVFMEICNHEVICLVARDLREQATAKTHRLPLSYLDSQPTGDVVSRIINDVDVFAEGLLAGLCHIFKGILLIIGTLLILWHYNPTVTLVIVILTPLSMIVTAFVARKTHRHFVEQAAIRGEETALISELMDGQEIIHAYSHEKRTLAEFDEVNERLGKSSLKATFFSSLANPCTRAANGVIYACVCCVGALIIVLDSSITIGQFGVFITHAAHFAHPFNEISGVITELQNAFTCVERIFGLLDVPDEASNTESKAKPDTQGAVELRDVCFGYLPATPVLKNIDISVKPGQCVAIVGPTGSGKTTLINLLMRFYDPDSGQILLDGVDTRSIDRAELRKSMGMVLQDTWLHSGTIRDNIAYGNPDATQEQVIAAAKAAHAHSFIRKLPRRYNTVISEDGDTLSHGQQQLLCLARLMLSPSPILLLDEATSSIDLRTERKIQKALSELLHGRTSFVVAHRLSTIKQADLILVMNNGCIVERGTHDQLLAADGFYASMYQNQFAEFERE